MNFKKKYCVIIFCSLVLFPVTGQITGKWLKVNDFNTYSDPACQILEYSNDTQRLYSLDSLHTVSRLKIDYANNLFREYSGDSILEFEFQIKDSVTFIKNIQGISYIFEKDTTLIKKTVFEQVYHQLFPTKVNYPIDSILQKQYEFFFPTSFAIPHRFLQFDKKMCSEAVKNAMGADKCAYCKIERAHNTYFIVYYYQRDKKKFAVPIKEINKDHLVVYGVAGRDGFVKLYEIKQIKDY